MKQLLVLIFLFLVAMAAVFFGITLAIPEKPYSSLSVADTIDVDWPMFMHDPTHSGSTPATFSPTKGTNGCQLTSSLDVSPCLQIRWKRTLSDWPNGLAQPVVAIDTVYLATMDGKLFAWDISNGNERWVYNTGSPIATTPAVIDGKIFFGDLSGKIYGLNVADKSPVFNPIQTNAPIYSSPVVVKESNVVKVFIGNNDGKLYGINGVTGGNLFTPVDVKSAITSNPAYYSGVVLFAAENLYGYAIDSTTGAQKWKVQLDGELGRHDHPVVIPASNTVLFHTVPAHGNTGMGLKDLFLNVLYSLSGHGGRTKQTLDAILPTYQQQVLATSHAKSEFLVDISSGQEIKSFSVAGKSLQMIPLNLWYSNGQNYPVVQDNRYLIFSSFGGYVKLDTVSKEFTTLYDNQFIRGDEFNALTLADGWLYGGYMANVARLNVNTQQTEQLHGCKDCGDPPAYKPLDPVTNPNHWDGFTGDGATDTGQYFIVARGKAFWVSSGTFYAFW